MEITATNFRKNLFRLLERTTKGEELDVIFKGSRVRLMPVAGEKVRRVRRAPRVLETLGLSEASVGFTPGERALLARAAGANSGNEVDAAIRKD